MDYAMHAGHKGHFDGVPLCGADVGPSLGGNIVNHVEVVTCIKCRTLLGYTVGQAVGPERDVIFRKARDLSRSGLLRALDGKRDTAAMERAKLDLVVSALGLDPSTPLEAVMQFAMDLRNALVAAEYAVDELTRPAPQASS